MMSVMMSACVYKCTSAFFAVFSAVCSVQWLIKVQLAAAKGYSREFLVKITKRFSTFQRHKFNSLLHSCAKSSHNHISAQTQA